MVDSLDDSIICVSCASSALNNSLTPAGKNQVAPIKIQVARDVL